MGKNNIGRLLMPWQAMLIAMLSLRATQCEVYQLLSMPRNAETS